MKGNLMSDFLYRKIPGRRLYQYNEDDFIFTSNKIFFKIKVYILTEEMLLIGNFSLFLCLCIVESMVFKCWAEIKIEIECRLHCINIYNEYCTYFGTL